MLICTHIPSLRAPIAKACYRRIQKCIVKHAEGHFRFIEDGVLGILAKEHIHSPNNGVVKIYKKCLACNHLPYMIIFFLVSSKMWRAEERLLGLQTFRACPRDGTLVVVLGGGPVGLLSALERAHHHKDRVLVMEKRRTPSRSQVVALREEMATFLYNLMRDAKLASSPEKYESANRLYVKGVRYEQVRGRILTFQLTVLEHLLRILAEIFEVRFEEGTVMGVNEAKDMIYTRRLPDGAVEAITQPYDIAIDASGGNLQNVPSGTFRHPNLHPRHGKFELETSKEVWEQLGPPRTAPNMLEVPFWQVYAKYGDTWGLKRRPITRVFPFVDLGGNRKVYVGTELPFFVDGVEFVQWILRHHGVNVLEVRQTSTFHVTGLRYYEPGFDDATGTLRVGDALYEPHYLTASGINNAYGELTDMQLQTKTECLNELLVRRRDDYYKKVSEMLDGPEKAGKLFFQQ